MGKDVLGEFNERRTEAEAAAVRAAVESLLSAPAKVDFYSVARVSGVCRSTLYRNPDLRGIVESARDSQPDPWDLVRTLRAENALLRGMLGEAGTGDGRPCLVEYALVGFPRAA